MPEEIVPVPSEMKPLFTEEELYNLRSIKLSNGQDIIGCILSLDEKNVIVKRPCLLFNLIDNAGNTKVVLTKWQTFSISENHVINFNAVVSYCKVMPEMIEYYLTNVKQQVAYESTPKKETPVEYVWPEWMDKVTKQQIN
jgi:hypothetical protein